MIHKYEKKEALLKAQISAQNIRFKTLEKDYKCIKLKCREARSRNRQLAGEMAEIREALDRLVDVGPDGLHFNLIKDVVELHQMGCIDLIKVEHRMQIRDWIRAATYRSEELDRAGDEDADSDSATEVPAPRARVYPRQP